MFAETKLMKARTHLLLKQPFFAGVVLPLALVERSEVPTIATDGKSIFYNPNHINSISLKQIIFEICHEGLHVAFAHPARCGNRNPKTWEVAADLSVNGLCHQMKLEVPNEALFEQRFLGMDVVDIYNILMQEGGHEEQHSKCCCTMQQHSPNGDGDMPKVTMTDAEKAEMIAKGRQILSQAKALATMAGQSLAPAITDVVDGWLDPGVDFHALLHHFLEVLLPNDYTWKRPNPRHMWRGIYIPSLRSVEHTTAYIIMDTSSSISAEQFRYFTGALNDIIGSLRCRAVVIHADDRVNKIEHYEAIDLPIIEPSYKGRGGTDFRPAFDWLDREADEPPRCVVYLTDLECLRYPIEPDYPVMWVVPGKCSRYATIPPFGEVVEMKIA